MSTDFFDDSLQDYQRLASEPNPSEPTLAKTPYRPSALLVLCQEAGTYKLYLDTNAAYYSRVRAQVSEDDTESWPMYFTPLLEPLPVDKVIPSTIISMLGAVRIKTTYAFYPFAVTQNQTRRLHLTPLSRVEFFAAVAHSI